MSNTDPTDLERIDQQIRINELKERANELAGGNMHGFEAEGVSDDLREAFWARVIDIETAPETTNLEQLSKMGIVMPPADQLDDEHLTQKLWEVISELARLRVFLSSTDHLSDRELYHLLESDLLRHPTEDLPPESGWNCHLDILGGCSEQDLYLRNKYYADQLDRECWSAEFPDDEMPPHVDPPYDRDRHLPSMAYGRTQE